MKKTYTLLATLMLTIAAGAQTLKITTSGNSYSFSAAEMTESSPATFTDGTTLTINGTAIAISDITSASVESGSSSETGGDANTVSIVYSGSSATVTIASNLTNYVTASVSGAHVTITQSNTDAVDGDEITYVLSGSTTDGEFALTGSYKCTISLDGLTMTNPSGAAINITNSKRIQLSAKKSTTNTLTDCASGSQKACIYSKGQLQLQGNGTLNVVGNTKHAIKSGDYISVKNLTLNITSAVGDGINCEEYFLMKSGTVTISGVGDDGIQCDLGGDTSTGEIVATDTTDAHDDEDSGNVYLEGGTINVSVTADAAKCIKSEGDMRISGTTIVATTSGGGVWDSDKVKTKAASCLSADGNMTISGGTLTLTSTGAGGKGINVDGNFTATGGTTTVSTSGNAVVASSSGSLSVATSSSQLDSYDSDYKSSPKGVKVDGAITISDAAVISVTTTGAGGEGIESKSYIDITGGQTTIVASDDAINASYNDDTKSLSNAGDFTISGGYLYANSSGNDGIDANGNCYIKGGVVYAIGSGSPEVAIDANSEERKQLYITGGTIIAVGGLESGASISGGTCKYTSSWTASSWYALYNGSDLALAFKTPTSSSSGGNQGGPGGGPGGNQGGGSQQLVVYTTSTPSLQSGVTVSGGTEYFGGMANVGGTVDGGSSVTLSTYSGGNSGPGGR